jgi:hypothetical protein
MRSLTIGLIAVTCLALIATTTLQTAHGQQQRPGEIGDNRVVVENRRPDQAIPVVVQKELDVRARAVRQQWEYRTLVTTGADSGKLLASAGLDGWEAVGFQPSPGGWTLLLKRPR